MSNTELRGSVISGRGLATRDLLSLKQEIHPFVGEALCPGSLNIVLKHPVRLLDVAGFDFDQNRRALWRASFNGFEVWIYRWRECPFHIAEVLSPFNLRQRFNLKDGDPFVLEVDEGKMGSIGLKERLTWAALWIGRRNWHYTNNKYHHLCRMLGVAQQRPVVKGLADMSLVVMKEIVKRTPYLGSIARKIKRKLSKSGAPAYHFSRTETDGCANDAERQFLQVLNVVSYTKTSNSSYAAQKFPAAYHTININGHQVPGQRDPSKRLALVPVDFRDKTILDLGCNQGGMIHQLAAEAKWAVGVDYDPHMINAANRVKQATGAGNTNFYVLDLEKEPLGLISDFLPEQKVDICFLLSVCMWLDNWREVIDFAQAHCDIMLFETNGTALQQQKQVDYLRTRYRGVTLLSETSEDDPTQKSRSLLYLTEPVSLSSSTKVA